LLVVIENDARLLFVALDHACIRFENNAQRVGFRVIS
jgi:hypothetical protein